MRKGYLIFLLSLITCQVSGQFSLTLPGTYTQDFNGLGINTSTGVTAGDLSIVNVSLNGWFFSELPTSDLQITAGTGSSTTGDTYNFGAAAAADRTLGGLQSGSLDPTFGFYFTNNTGSIITSLAITYTGEQWRLGTAGRLDRIDFQYSLNATSLTTGNWLDANTFDFTAPVTTLPLGALDGNLAANRTTITNTVIGISIPVGTNFFIRWTDLDAAGADDGLGIDDFSLTAGFAPASTDHFRSIATGEWGSLSTWESSPDAMAWGAATAIPNSDANTVTIRNTHTVTFNSFLTIDQVVIEGGGTLDFNNGILTVNDGAGNDIDIQNNGAFVLSSANNPPAFTGATPVINIQGSGILRVSASGLTTTPGAGVHSNNYVYQHQSILEYTLNAPFGTVGVTYFPNAVAATIPVFRITQNIGAFVGSASNTVINGVFEANGNLTFTAIGTKTFRNGIRGTGNIGTSGSGQFIINGTTAELGGTGSLTVPAPSLRIGSGTTVDMISDKTITGNVALIATNSLIVLGNFNLTVTGTISITEVSSYVRTNGTGKLTIPITVLGFVGSKLFPVGVTTINPLFIQSGTFPASYSARVVQPIVPTIYNDMQAVLRAWYITSSETAPGATIGFGYSFTPVECGPLYNNAGPVEVGVNIGGVWIIHQLNLTPMPFFLVPGTFTVTPNPINYFNNPATEFPFVIANNGAVLPLDYFIVSRAQKVNNTAVINWKVFDTDNVINFEVQRSVDNGGFQTIATVSPVPQQMEYSITDTDLPKGTNLYRIKVNRHSGGIRYSNTTAVINDIKGLLITSVNPNPLQSQALITLSAAKNERVLFHVYDMEGRRVKQWYAVAAPGNNIIPLNMNGFPGGIYQVVASAGNTQAIMRFVKQ